MHALLSKLLSADELRRRVVFTLEQDYFEDLGIVVPIEHNLQCPIVRKEYWVSFSDIFVSDEYLPAFQKIPPPSRWIDLGCHAGFFSLLMLLLRKRRGMQGEVEALLVDGDARVQKSIDEIARLNKGNWNLKFQHGAISKESGSVVFEEGFMMSSQINAAAEGTTQGRRVPVARPEDLLKALPGPYDLVKIDAEGAEHDFLTSYEPVLRQTRYILMEWHSWHFGGGGLPTIREATAKAGFREVLEVVPSHAVDAEATRFCGVLLFEKA